MIKQILQYRHLARREFRHFIWALSGKKFASQYSTEKQMFNWTTYSCPIVNHPSQAHLINVKIDNMKLAAKKINGLQLLPGEIFSFWKIIGRPSSKAGFGSGPTFVNGKITVSPGGGLCQISGLLFNLALEAGLEVLERHSHTLDAYGDRRYLPLGRDATVAWISKNLIFQNSTNYPISIHLEIADQKTTGFITSQHQEKPQVDLQGPIILDKKSDDLRKGFHVKTRIERDVVFSNGKHHSQSFESLYFQPQSANLHGN